MLRFSLPFLFFFLFLPFSAFCQNASIGTSLSSPNQIKTFDSELEISGRQLHFNQKQAVSADYWSISPNRKLIVSLNLFSEKSEFSIYDSKGNLLNTFSINELDSEDKSLAIFISDQAVVGIRHTIGVFDAYNWDGKFLNTLSNLSGSNDGEKISDYLLHTASFNFTVSNPFIKNQEKSNSAIALMNPLNNQKLTLGYASQSQPYVYSVSSKNKLNVFAHSPINKKKSTVIVSDNFGNRLNEIEVEIDEILGANLDETNQFLTVYSANRMQVYQLSNGNRLGSSSVRGNPLFYAFYNKTDNILVGLTGLINESEVQKTEIQAVHLGKKKLVRSQNAVTAKLLQGLPIIATRKKAGEFDLSGFNSVITIRTSF